MSVILYNLFAVEPKIKILQKIKKEYKSEECMEIDVNNGKKQSLFVDLPKEIELKISDLTIDQQVCYNILYILDIL